MTRRRTLTSTSTSTSSSSSPGATNAMSRSSHQWLSRCLHNLPFHHPILLLILCFVSAVHLSASAKSPDYYDCEDEGFFPHPKDCRKYFWCLDSGPANLGIVPHAFTCPSGLYFNTKTEACDYPANVPCANEKKNKTLLTRTRIGNKKKSPTSTTTTSPDIVDDEIVFTTLVPTTTEVVTTTTIRSEKLLKEPGVSHRRRVTAPPLSVPSTSSISPTSSATSTPSTDNLKELLKLVQSLGGVERVKTLVDKEIASNNQRQNDQLVGNNANNHQSESVRVRVNSRTPPTTTPATFFTPTYETPKRQPEIATTTTDAPLVPSHSNQVRHRRPQHQSQPTIDEASSPAVTTNPFLSYADPSRGPSTDPPGLVGGSHIEEDNNPVIVTNDVGDSNRVQNGRRQQSSNFYSFSYNTPGSRVSISSQIQPPIHNDHQPHLVTRSPANDSPFSDPFFNYNSPGGRSNAGHNPVTVTDPPPPTTIHDEPLLVELPQPKRERPRNHESGYVRVRVNPSSQLVPSTPQSSSGRRATRVRIANPGQINPGNFANSELNHQHLPRRQPITTTTTNNQPSPGVLYDEDRSLDHLNRLVTEVPVEIVTTRRPLRRRPPQREHLRNRQEENPVGALVNLPPPNLQLDPHPSQPAHPHFNQPPPQTGIPNRPFPVSHRSNQNPPRILPIAVPLVTLPPRPDAFLQPVLPNNHHQRDQHHHPHPSSFPHQPFSNPFNPSVESFRSGNSVPYPPRTLQTSPRPSTSPFVDDLYVTDFPFFDSGPHDVRQTHPPQTFAPTTLTVPTTTTTTTTTTSTTTPAPLTTVYREPPVTGRSRQRGRQRSRPQVSLPVTSPVAISQPTRPPRRSTTTTTTLRPTSAPLTGSISSGTGPLPEAPPVEMDSGSVKCTRRGVFAHPGSCGQFVVCAPASRGSTTYRSYLHHCPAEQVFVEEVGRCRPGNKERCEVFT